jgi:membrane protein
MDARVRRAVDLGRAIVHETRTEKITFLAGSLAYHAFISLLPLLVLVLVAITTLGNSVLEQGYMDIVRGLLAPGGSDATAADLFIEELRNTGESTGLSLVGGAVLLWGTMRIFRGLDTAFSDIYETEAENTFLDQISDGILVLVAFVAAVVVAGGLQQLVPSGALGFGWRTVRFCLLLGGLTLTLYPMYFVFPDTDVTFLEVVPGTVFAALGLTSLQTLFGIYLEFSGSGGESGLITGVLVLLTWLYFASLVMLEGVVLNAVISNRSADVDVEPLIGGVPPTYEEDRPSVERESLVDALTHLDSLLGEGKSLTISVGDDSVSLPAPQTHETDTEKKLFELGGGRLGLTLRWGAGTTPPGTETDTESDVDEEGGVGDAEERGSATAEEHESGSDDATERTSTVDDSPPRGDG